MGRIAGSEHVRRVEEAASWKTRLTEIGQESGVEFEAWLAADPGNEAAWRQVEAPLALLSANATAQRVIAARRDALDRAHRHNKPDLPAWSRIAAVLAMVGVATAFYLAIGWLNARPDVYATDHGERRVVRLADGSRVSLDAETEVRVRLDDQARRLELLRGQARFDVAHDPARPFSVRVGDQIVIATGTAFNIDMLGPQVLITLIEGRVEVVRDDGGAALIGARARPVALRAGQQLAMAPDVRPTLRPANLASTTAWTAGQLVFADEPLASVAERVSRYADNPIRVAPEVQNLRVSGVFQTNDAEGFVSSITAYLPVRARQSADGGVELAPRE